MVERLDIDALLVGALYGELSSAEQARLQAHLESHPADRTALDDLKSARQAVRESRIFEAQLEPPQAVSALLLQEAHRRAPKKVRAAEEQEGWFARFVASFMRHPAMAAAAMLVLVVGVASTLALRDKGAVATKEADTSEKEPSLDQTIENAQGEARGPAAAETVKLGKDTGAMGSAAAADSYRVDLDDKNLATKPEAPADDGVAHANLDEKKAVVAKKPAKKGLEVNGRDRAPKDLEGADFETETLKADELSRNNEDTQAFKEGFAKAPSGASGGGGNAPGAVAGQRFDATANANGLIDGRTTTGAGTAGPGTAAPRPTTTTPSPGPAAGKAKTAPPSANAAPTAPTVTQAAPPPPPPQRAQATGEKIAPAPAAEPSVPAPPAEERPTPPKPAVTKAPAKPTEQAKSEAKPDASKKATDEKLVAWAKQQHAAAKQAAANGRCNDAAAISVKIQNSAPDYYSAYVATDRALKGCQAYINDAREKDAEQSSKSRASKRINADAPAANSK